MKIILAYDKETDSYREVLVSDEDFVSLSKQKWTISNGYAGPMHRIIALRMGLTAEVVDHKNRNKLDNQRENLRAATCSQNQMNIGPQINNKSGYRGVCYITRLGKWRAKLRMKVLGYFASKEEAALAWNKEAKEQFGEFAFQNNVISKSYLYFGSDH